MDERFIPLVAFVRGSNAVAGTVPEAAAAAPEAMATGLPLPADPRDSAEFAYAPVVRELTLMRLAAHEAFERSKGSLLAALAEHVLGRELALAPAELKVLVARVLEASRELEPVSLALCAVDAERIRTPLRTRIDPSLRPGDFIVEVRDGALESPLRFRLRAALERASPGAV